MRRVSPLTTTCAMAVVVLGLVAAGCEQKNGETDQAPPAAPGTYAENDAIPTEVSEPIHDIERRLLDSFEAGNPAVLEGLLAGAVRDELQEGQGLKPMFETMRRGITGAGMESYYDLYLSEPPGNDQPIRVTAQMQPAFVLEFQAPGVQSYVSLREIISGIRTLMLAIVYGRDDASAEWRIYNMRLGRLKASYRDAMQWYSEATGFQSQGRLLPALMRLEIATDLLEPAPFMRYVDEQKVTQLRERIAGELEARNTFPIALDGLPGTPRILFFEPAFLDAAPSVHVGYVTGGAFDQAAVDAEVDVIRERVAEMFPGVCVNGEKIAFTAYREQPTDPDRQYESIDSISECPKLEF